ncbi:MAG: hypothetical protein H7X95_02660 [Deltaproteobacteria bacterium]|nr:hypothetical protein [Deltaproteobacteria bacterium]
MRRFFLIVTVALATGWVGCAAAPAGPRGPLLGPGIEAATDWSYARAAAAATLSDGLSTKGGADNYWGDLTILPRRLEGRLSPLPWFDIGGQIGWLGGGADARIGIPALPGRFLAVNLAAGIDTGDIGPTHGTKPTRSRWVRLETYPALPFLDFNFRLVVAAGIHAGRFFHQLPDPRPQASFNDGFAPGAINIIRNETRLETSVGAFLFPRPEASFLFTISPYFVLDADAPGPGCVDCSAPVVDYRQSWGLVVVTRYAFRHGF